MANPSRMVPIPGSERKAKKGATVVGVADPSHRITVTVYVRRNPKAPPPPPLEQEAMKLPRERKYLSHAEAAKVFGAAQEDLDKVAAFARANNLTVLESNAGRRSVSLSGTVADMNKAFGVELKHYETPTENYRGREGPVHVPSELDGIIELVVGLDNRRLGRSLLRHGPPRVQHLGLALPPAGFLPTQLAGLYNFPKKLDGTGQCIGIFAFNDFGGGIQSQCVKDVLRASAPGNHARHH